MEEEELLATLISVGTAEQIYNGNKKQPDNQWGIKALATTKFCPNLLFLKLGIQNLYYD